MTYNLDQAELEWAQFLPVADQQLMLRELSHARSASERKRLLHEWRVTAEALRDPNARAVLLQDAWEDSLG